MPVRMIALCLMLRSQRAAFLSLATLLLFAMLACLLWIFPAQAQEPNYKELVMQQDRKAEAIMNQRNLVLLQQKQTRSFCSEAGLWFKKYEDINQEIRQLQKEQQDGYSTFSDDQLQSQIDSLFQRRLAITHPTGGITLQGTTYANLDAVQAEMTSLGHEVPRLNKKYSRLSQELSDVEAQRDTYMQEVSNESALWLAGKQRSLLQLQEKYAAMQEAISDHTYWIEIGKGKDENGIPLLYGVERRMGMLALVKEYRKELQQTGKPYDANVMASKIREARDLSNQSKSRMQNEFIPALQAQISSLLQEIGNFDPNVDISGCWILPLQTSPQPTLIITETTPGEFKATIMNTEKLKYYNDGDLNFRVARTNATTFDGTNYTHDTQGDLHHIPLRIIANEDGTKLDMRSDEQFVLSRCQ